MKQLLQSLRDYRGNRAALFDGIEEGGIRASSSYSSHEIDEHDNDRALDGLQDRVILLKRLSGDINEEVDSHNRILDHMGNDMDSSRGILSGTMDRFKMPVRPVEKERGNQRARETYPLTEDEWGKRQRQWQRSTEGKGAAAERAKSSG
ncbi:Bet1-like SNARE 1-1 [Acorus calamus]|uniref:Bet1-like SNARE 1-1 n=1 Tax=Acorus calamus TaxID=4465 RepID=A0AAV9EEN4_ACOCL|nr:Bet1-like SNARE 1-1 [Acorus calamus]